MSSSEKAYVLLDDGAWFPGTARRTFSPATGEVVFTTNLSGYQEVFTDPSYLGQIVTMTAPMIGNYGVNQEDLESGRPQVNAVVVRELSDQYSNWRAKGALDDWLAEAGVPLIEDVDTRRLTRHIRQHGAMPVAIGSDVNEAELAAVAAAAPHMNGQDLATRVSTTSPYLVTAPGERRGRVVAIDLGIKRDILTQLGGRGLDVQVVPASTRAAEIIGYRPDGVFVSNGPGDPEPLAETVSALRGVLGKVPIFGICLGHQVLGLAMGARTFKLPFGHHGGNHPVRRLRDGRVAITSQNHGFAVDLWSLSGDAPRPEQTLPGPGQLPASVDTDFGTTIPTHQNLNDGTLEGMESRDVAAFSVQFHPEAAPGPRDSVGLFDDFLELMDRA